MSSVTKKVISLLVLTLAITTATDRVNAQRANHGPMFMNPAFRQNFIQQQHNNVSTGTKQLVVTLHSVSTEGVGQEVGTVTITESNYGVVFTPDLKGLTPGIHGFHIHQNPSCEAAEKDGVMVAAQAAGGHLDPQATNKHDFPWGDGHLGDLPPLYIEADGTASQPVLGPRLKFSDVLNHSLMLHAGGDNHSDHPTALGGGGARMSCGVIGQS